MRRSAWFRSVASLLALWLPLVAGEPGLLQPCTMHGAERLVLASLGVGSSSHAAPDAHGTHGRHDAAPDARSTSAPAQGHDAHDCSCIDGCTVASAVALPAPAADIELGVVSVVRSTPTRFVEAPRRSVPEHTRPFTTGPPRA